MARSAIINVMVQAVRKAGRAIIRDFGELENLQVSRKGPADFVTHADKRADEILQDDLSHSRPGYGFLTEESGRIAGKDDQHCWIIDPIDGTTNFMHGVPHFSISVALERQGRLEAGVIYNPVLDELFTAERGDGAYLNDRRLRVANRQDLAESLVASGFANDMKEGPGESVKDWIAMNGKGAVIRRTGSSALDLAYVAAGRFDGYWDCGLGYWDVAAGILLVREAGGIASDLQGRPDKMEAGNIIAGNETLHRAMLSTLRENRE